MTESKYAPTVWGAPKFTDLEVPSGQLCQVRPAGVQQLISAGVLESADTLTSMIDEKHIKRTSARGGKTTGKPAQTGANTMKMPDGSTAAVNTDSLLKDPEQLNRVFTLVDKTVAHMVVQPVVKRPVKVVDGKEVELPHTEREEGVVYTDMIELADKMFVFQYAVGGDTDLESFRKRFGEGVAGVAAE